MKLNILNETKYFCYISLLTFLMAFYNLHEIKNLDLKLDMCLFPVSCAEWLPLVFILVC